LYGPPPGSRPQGPDLTAHRHYNGTMRDKALSVELLFTALFH
jgi:hypothetical protein